MEIKEIKRAGGEVLEAVQRLLPQLDPGSEPLTRKQLELILKSPGTHLFIAVTDEEEIAGMLTLVHYMVSTGLKCWIEDVVVDERFRGRGIGKELLRHAVEYAGKNGAKSVDLTSRPERLAANKLYRELGFELRNTNVYRYVIRNAV